MHRGLPRVRAARSRRSEAFGARSPPAPPGVAARPGARLRAALRLTSRPPAVPAHDHRDDDGCAASALHAMSKGTRAATRPRRRSEEAHRIRAREAGAHKDLGVTLSFRRQGDASDRAAPAAASPGRGGRRGRVMAAARAASATRAGHGAAAPPGPPPPPSAGRSGSPGRDRTRARSRCPARPASRCPRPPP